MAQADNKVLILGALAGVAGIGLAVACYQGYKMKRRASLPAHYLCTNNELATGMTLMNSPGLHGNQIEVLDRLEALLQCVSELKDEMKALKNTLPMRHGQVGVDLRAGDRSDAHRAAPLHRTTPTRRKRSGSSIAGATAGGRSSEEAESEGGYITALTDSDEDEQSDDERLDERRETTDKLTCLLERVDSLHQGTEADKRESLHILTSQREEFGHNSTFLWRLIRAYCDVHDISDTLEEKKNHAETGKKVGEEAVALNPRCAESHQWYAIMCGIMAEYDTVQNKIKNGYIFKDHLDKAIELKPQDPLSYYLLGRWCYAVAQLSWLERKVAAALFGEPPSATVEDALKNFLKVEDIHPRYSKLNYVFLAKCYRDIGVRKKAREMCEAAESMQSVSKEDEDAQKELDLLCPQLGMLDPKDELDL
ncbi:regulator of microtubule dynamics protein 2 [Hippocampus zosterae]|uniref:regulator of microtubule dynamics protein 2 n=1 Tax=Hippocampus zosterae TaxID=109293 RepID=UPI00223D9235|nr:regulator of microtubule dynamics protein 2 [Hippocampus zosterae]XP_051935316.1 regulator of microtubule dynamics protein 2 [Hippocampus zosterae]XP_051935317.1 regulator of microtubule dynamics protein 2 [Hippocampus zosterae]XP_051935319.1 regulator of microtubule dynamics protein 2 [Hippocampus zosterae]XP_051935320.1 regulator of microtubule dynamics protein 2 [Hippocampus zosterae]XP_051935321.1 regulator of microtubule dynamics protein 2 [Hippocampus zosterae]